MGLTISGIGSGIDVASIVTALVTAEFAPKQVAITSQQEVNSQRLSAYGELAATMDAMNTAMQELAKDGTFNSMSGNSSNVEAVGITATTEAHAGSYNVNVTELASAHKISSTRMEKDAAMGTGSLTISNGVDAEGNAKSFTVDVTEDAQSLNDIADAINSSEENTNVTASVVNDKEGGSYLVLSSKLTGEDNQIKVEVAADDPSSGLTNLAYDGADTSTMTQQQKGQNAQLTIDGIAVTSGSNRVSGAVDGVTFELKKTTESAVTTSVAADTTSSLTAMNKFVDSYNAYRDKSGGLTAYSEKNDIAGALNGDSATRMAYSQTTRLLGSSLGGDNSIQTFADLGISLDKEGTMTLDEAKFTAQLEKDPNAVQNFFVGTDPTTVDGKTTYGTEGMASRMQTLTDAYSGKEGMFTTKQTSLASQNVSLDQDMADLNIRMNAYQSQMTDKYNAMDLAIANANAQMSYVSALFPTAS